MGLKNITLPSAEVAFSGGKFAVRGLSFDNIAYLVRKHKDGLRSLFDSFQEQGDLTTAGAMQFVVPLVEKMPSLAADIIACGSGDHKDAAIAAGLPFPVQVEALEKIIDLTFSVDGGVKKLLETVVRMAQGTTALIETLTA